MPNRSRTKKKTPKLDVNQMAARLVATATGQSIPKLTPGKNPMAQALGALGGAKGGPARAAKMTAEERRASASRAARARWAKERAAQ